MERGQGELGRLEEEGEEKSGGQQGKGSGREKERGHLPWPLKLPGRILRPPDLLFFL